METDNIKELLTKEIEDELEALSGLGIGSEKYNSTVDGITKLSDRLIAIDKMNAEQNVKYEQIDTDKNVKERQLVNDEKDRKTKNWLTAGSIVLPILATIWGTLVTINFEQTGTVTTIMGRGFFQKLLPKK